MAIWSSSSQMGIYIQDLLKECADEIEAQVGNDNETTSTN